MKKYSLILVILSICLFGCSNGSQESYNSKINEGVSLVKEKQYGKAEAYFETALKENKDDKMAKSYLDQTKEIQEVIEDISDGKIDDGLESIEKIENAEIKLEEIQAEAGKYREQLESAQMTLSKLTQEYEESQKLADASDYDGANKLLNQIKEENTKEAFYTDIMDKVTQLSESIAKKTTQNTTTEKKSESKTASSFQESKSKTNSIQRRYSIDEQKAIRNEFLNWAGERAQLGGMAVNGYYFDHGASGKGAWYAKTNQGQYILVQEQTPDVSIDDSTYVAHAIGGVVFYYSQFGTTGLTDEINDSDNNPSMATGFSQVANSNKPIVKYLLADNGVVYEYESSSSFTDGFYITDDDGNFDYLPGQQKTFKISEDQDAQEKLQEILSEYN